MAAAVRRLADDRPLGREMGWNGRRCVEAGFDRAKLAEKLALLVESMVRR